MTAETAVVLPVLVALTMALVWLLSLATAQTRVVDAARETARAVARDDPRAAAIVLGRRVAPAGADIEVVETDGLVTVRVKAPVPGPGGLLRFLPRAVVAAEAVAAAEGGEPL